MNYPVSLAALAAFAGECLFPGGCAVCGRPLPTPMDAWYGLCAECRAGLTVEPGERCRICGRPLISETGACAPCRARLPDGPPALDRVVSLYPFTGAYRRLLLAFKFDRAAAAGRFLAERLSDAAAASAPGAVLVPVPPRPGKLRETGWDQIEFLARRVERAAPPAGPRPVVYRCLRRLESRTQKYLSLADRRANLRGRVVAYRPPPRDCVLFDDVITSGATMEACAAALREAGAARVRGVCLFYN